MGFKSTLRAPTRHFDVVSNWVQICSLALHNVNGLHETSTDWIFRLRFAA
jgi:hypothetical protein